MPLLIIGGIAYLVFTFMFLVRNYDVCNERSTLWVYVVITLLINGLQATFYQYTADGTNTFLIRNVSIGLIANLVILIYGASVIFGDVVCDNMKHTGLWIIANFMFAVSVIFVSFILGLLCWILYVYQKNGAKPWEIKKPSRRTSAVPLTSVQANSSNASFEGRQNPIMASDEPDV